MTSFVETVRQAHQDFHKARVHVMLLAVVDGDDDRSHSGCAVGCVYTVAA